MGQSNKQDESNLSNQKPSPYHTPVLLPETIDGLNIVPDGIYVDCTFGGGGHSRALLKRLSASGKLVVFDQDAAAKQNAPDDERLLFVPQNFRHLQRFLRANKIQQVDGIMADLGVSSHQFDEADRGFSIRFDAALDMRMDNRQEKTAAQLLAAYSETELHKLFEAFGEVTNAKTLARTIVAQRAIAPLNTINRFKEATAACVKGNPNKYFAQVFQALRIAVNDELGALKEMLEQSAQVMKPGGRLAIISFHSLEDRIVKNYMKTGTADDEAMEEDVLYGNRSKSPWKLINKKPIVANATETSQNPRSRSAKLRIAERR